MVLAYHATSEVNDVSASTDKFKWMYCLQWICDVGAMCSLHDDRYNEFSYLATASLYTNPAVARLTTSKHKSEPSILKEKWNIETGICGDALNVNLLI